MSPEWSTPGEQSGQDRGDAVTVDAHSAWDRVLTDLEVAVARADAVGVAVPAWTPPTGLGRIPRELVGRASRLLAAQRDAVARVDAARRDVAAHLGALRSVASSRAPEPARYLDVTG